MEGYYTKMLGELNALINRLAEILPLELFIFVGSFLEEIIAPIPSILVTTVAGTIALAAGYSYVGLILLAVLASIGKSLGCAIIYVIADKSEDFLLVRFGPALGISHAEVERIGKHFTGSFRDYAILVLIRALPVSPSLPISVAAGLIKVPFAFYNIATFIGNFLRSILFLAVGYSGLSAYRSLFDNLGSIESLIQIALAIMLVLVVVGIYYVRHTRSRPEQDS